MLKLSRTQCVLRSAEGRNGLWRASTDLIIITLLFGERGPDMEIWAGGVENLQLEGIQHTWSLYPRPSPDIEVGNRLAQTGVKFGNPKPRTDHGKVQTMCHGESWKGAVVWCACVRVCVCVCTSLRPRVLVLECAVWWIGQAPDDQNRGNTIIITAVLALLPYPGFAGVMSLTSCSCLVLVTGFTCGAPAFNWCAAVSGVFYTTALLVVRPGAQCPELQRSWQRSRISSVGLMSGVGRKSLSVLGEQPPCPFPLPPCKLQATDMSPIGRMQLRHVLQIAAKSALVSWSSGLNRAQQRSRRTCPIPVLLPAAHGLAHYREHFQRLPRTSSAY
jgi:hypothetical protein